MLLAFSNNVDMYKAVTNSLGQFRSTCLNLQTVGPSQGEKAQYPKTYEPRCEKTGLWGFRPGLTQTRL